jgi:hypothetical protein
MQKAIAIVVRDIERASGFPGFPSFPQASHRFNNIYTISNSTPYAKKLATGHHDKIELVVSRRGELLDTHELLTHEKTVAFMKKLEKKTGEAPMVIVFKNTKRIEEICSAQGWKLLNPKAELAQKIEEKIAQIEWLGEEGRSFLPPHLITTCKDITWQTLPIPASPTVIQFNHAHSGEGTLLIRSEAELAIFKATYGSRFPNRPVRLTTFIDGPAYTLNCIVHSDGTVSHGSINYQITGIAPFTDNPFTTIGNDWSFARHELTQIQRQEIHDIARSIGRKMANDGWRGLFGIDVISSKEGRVHLIEINARQPAGASFESILAEQTKKNQEVSVLEAHVRALIDEKPLPVAEISEGAQIIARITPHSQKESMHMLEKELSHRFTVIPYVNEATGSELVRIQSPHSFIKTHQELNSDGELIAALLKPRSQTLRPQAQLVIADFSTLPFPPAWNHPTCPYYNNRRIGMRAGLRALIGKGTAQDIVDEAILIALREKKSLDSLSAEELKRYLVDQKLGIDCSGYAYYVLDAESRARGHKPLRSRITFLHHRLNLIRAVICFLRPVENCGTKVFSHEKNSHDISLMSVAPGDFLSFISTGPQKDYHHIAVISEIARDEKGGIKKIHYTHSFAFPTDGTYGGGIKHGSIEITDIHKPLVEQIWDESYTHEKAKEALSFTLRRLN